ncbi:L-rhamnose mutarotase [Bacteroides thetaiotaomicron]|nr:L-rhamnose mutarotase [Bacteroides thetaiotaomicron]
MKREAFKMYLKPGYEAEYEKRHAAIWPELKALLSKNGVSDYSNTSVNFYRKIKS